MMNNYTVYRENNQLCIDRINDQMPLPIDEINRGVYEMCFYDFHAIAYTIDEAIMAYEEAEAEYYARKQAQAIEDERQALIDAAYEAAYQEMKWDL